MPTQQQITNLTTPAWEKHSGKSVTIYALPGSYAARQAARLQREAEQIVATLKKLLAAHGERDESRADIYLADPLGAQAAGETGRDALLYVVQPDAPGEPLAFPLTRLFVARWFGAQAATATGIVSGLTGVVAARAQTGASVAEADAWAQAESEAGHGVSPDADPRAATSFAAFLLGNFGAPNLRRFLESYDPSRHDQAAMDAFQQPLGVLQETWLAGLRRKAGGKDAFRTFLHQVLPLLRPYRRQQMEILVYLLLAAAYNVVTPLAAKWFIQDLTNASKHKGTASFLHITDTAGVVRFTLILLVIYVLGGLVSMRRNYAVTRLNLNVLNDLQGRLFAHLQRLPHSFYANAKTGDLMTRLTGDMENVQGALSQITNKGLYQIFTLTGGILALLYTSKGNPILALLMLLIVPLFAITYVGLRARNKAASREQRKRVALITNALQENLTAQPVIKAYRMEERAVADYRARTLAQTGAKLRLTMLGALSDFNEDMATAGAQLIIFGVGGYLVLAHRGIGAADLAAALLLVKVIFNPITSLAGIGQNLQQATGSMDRVAELYDEPVTIEDKPDAIALPRLSREIQLDHVTFSYSPGHPILRDLSVTIPAGTNIAFVGSSGSGKSTTVNLLMRFYDPDAGGVLFDGHDLRDVTLASLRDQIAIVFQDTFVFDTTLRENIRIGRPGATDADVAQAARAARLESVIETLPAGYETVLGERGTKFSGGQRQRLAIARAILRNPRILILDEATSALDEKTQAEIQETLREVSQGRTTISITHRLSWAAMADRIFVMDQGQLVEQGTHAELTRAGGVYQKLWEESGGSIGGDARDGIDTALESYLAEIIAGRLQNVPLFAGLNAESRAQVAQKMRLERRAPGAEIVRQGESGDTLYLIGQGQVDVLLTEDGSEQRINTLSGGDYFGEMALLSDTPRRATVRAITDVQLYSLAKSDFNALLRREPTLRQAVSDTVAARQSALDVASVLSAGQNLTVT